MTDIIGDPQFALGDISITEGAHQLIEGGLLVQLYIDRHWRGDWGDLDEEDKIANEDAIFNGSRILSCYDTAAGKILIITDADRSTTTVLTPDEY